MNQFWLIRLRGNLHGGFWENIYFQDKRGPRQGCPASSFESVNVDVMTDAAMFVHSLVQHSFLEYLLCTK